MVNRLTAAEACAMTECADVESRIEELLVRKRKSIDEKIKLATCWGQGQVRLLWEHPSHQTSDYSVGGYGSDGSSYYTAFMAKKIIESLQKDGFQVSLEKDRHIVVKWTENRFNNSLIDKAVSVFKAAAKATTAAFNVN